MAMKRADRRKFLRTSVGIAAANVALFTGKTTAVQAGNSQGSESIDPGEAYWEYSLRGPVTSSPTVVDGIVYIGAGTSGERDGTLYAVDADSGEEVWEQPRNGSEYQGEFISGAPKVEDETVYVAVSEGSAVDEQMRVYALAASTGDIEWTFPDTDEDGYGGWSESSVTVGNDRVFFGETSGSLVALDKETGELEWEVNPARQIRSAPLYNDGTIYIGSDEGDALDPDGNLYAYDAETGEQEWVFTEPGREIQSAATVSDGTIYVGSNDGSLYAVDPTDGTEVWSFDEPDEAVSWSPTVANGILYVGGTDSGGFDSDGALYAIDTETGEAEWVFDDPSRTFSSPTIVGDTVIVGTLQPGSGEVYGIDADDGTELWSYTGLDGLGVRSSPTVVDGTAFIGGDTDLGSGQLMAIETGESGSSRGSRMEHRTLGHHDRLRGETNGTGDADDSGPGFGVGGAVVGLGGAGYLLKRRFDEEGHEM